MLESLLSTSRRHFVRPAPKIVEGYTSGFGASGNLRLVAAAHQVKYSSMPQEQCQSGQAAQHRRQGQAVCEDVAHICIVKPIRKADCKAIKHSAAHFSDVSLLQKWLAHS